MHPRRILIVNVHSLLMEIMLQFLSSNGSADFDVVNTLASNLPDLIDDVRELQPRIIVIDETTSFIKPAKLIVALLKTQNIRVIALNSHTNKMDIYDKCESVISHPSHFIAALDFEGDLSNQDGGAM